MLKITSYPLKSTSNAHIIIFPEGNNPRTGSDKGGGEYTGILNKFELQVRGNINKFQNCRLEEARGISGAIFSVFQTTSNNEVPKSNPAYLIGSKRFERWKMYVSNGKKLGRHS